MLQYSFTDIADDGIEELIIGVCNIEKQEYSQLAIYSYQNGGIHMVLEGAGYDMSIHEGALLNYTRFVSWNEIIHIIYWIVILVWQIFGDNLW